MKKSVLQSNLRITVSLILFIAGLYFVCNVTHADFIEGFVGAPPLKSCPSVLIQKDNKIYMYYKGEPEVPGMNPVIFDNLEEYSEYVEYLRSKGRHCPVLFLREQNSANGGTEYKIYPSPSDKEVSLSYIDKNAFNRERNLIDANMINNPGHTAGYDPSGFDNGVETPLDKMYHSREAKSDNAMDTNWGGVEYSRKSVEQGKYVKYTREVQPKRYNFLKTSSENQYYEDPYAHAKKYRVKRDDVEKFWEEKAKSSSSI